MATKRKTAAKTAPVEKHPQLRALKTSLEAKKEKILEKSAPARKEREKLLAQIQPLEAKLREVNKEIAKIERPHLGAIDTEISAIAKAMGGRSMSDVNTPLVEEEK